MTSRELFIRKQLLTVMHEKDVNDIFSNERYLRSFNRIFIHESVDAENNYEIDEQVGDAYIKLVTVKWVDKTFPTMPLDKRSRLIATIIAKGTLSKIGYTLGFRNHIESREPVVSSTIEDVMEAFISVLARVSESEFGFGMDYIYTTRYLTQIFQSMNFDIEKMGARDWKTQLKEDVVDVLNWKKSQLSTAKLNSDLWRKIPLCLNMESRVISTTIEKIPSCRLLTLELFTDPFGNIITWVISDNSGQATKFASESALRFFTKLGLIKPNIIKMFGNASDRPSTIIKPSMMEKQGINYILQPGSLDDKIQKVIQRIIKMQQAKKLTFDTSPPDASERQKMIFTS